MTVIDLGRVDHEGDDPPAASRPRPLRRSEWRRLLVAVIAVCCVLTVTGSARPDPRGLVQLWDVPFALDANAYLLSGDDVFVLEHSGERRLTAHDARTGAVRWSIAADTAELAGVKAGTLLMSEGFTVINHEEPDGSSSSRQFSRDTVGVDTATGRRLWQQPGEIATTLGDHALLLEWDETGGRARRIRMVRLGDGGTVWSRDRADAVSWTIDRAPGVPADRLLTVTAQGRAEVISLADGSVVTTGTLPRPITAQTDQDYSVVTLQGRQLYQDQTVRGRTTITAYDIDTLRQLWTVEQSSSSSFDCGPVVCISDGESIFGHDRATGARRWQLSGIAGVSPLTGGRLLTADEQGARHTVLAGATGQRIADLGRGMPVWDSRGRLRYLIAGTLQPPGRTSVSSFDPASAAVVLRGTVAAAQTCRTERDLLTCVTEDNRLTVTDVG
jgi:outer membrane protein assembly factor BamB